MSDTKHSFKTAKIQAVKAFRGVVQAQAEQELTHEFTLGSILGICAFVFEIYGEDAADAVGELLITSVKRSQGPE